MVSLPITGSQVSPLAADFEAGLRAWVAKGSGLAEKWVIKGNSYGVSPIGPYATVLLVNPVQRGRPYQRRARDVNGNVGVETYARATDQYSVQWFRKGAQDMARRFSIWAYSPEGQREAKTVPHPFTLMRIVNILQLDDIIATSYEPRYGVTMDIGFYLTVRETLEPWASAEVIVKEGDDTETITAGA